MAAKAADTVEVQAEAMVLVVLKRVIPVAKAALAMVEAAAAALVKETVKAAMEASVAKRRQQAMAI